ncbi:hypothetical protein D3C84_679100 [compost metagenome]
MRVQTANADTRFLQAIALERSVDQLNRLNHPLLTEQTRDFGQGHVGGHPRRPQIVEHVEFAERPVEIQQLGKPVQFVVVRHAGHVQRGLVQRPEQDRIGGPGFGQAQGLLQRVEAVATANHTGLAAREFTDRLTAKVVEQWRVIDKLQRLQSLHATIRKLGPGDAHATTHFGFVGDQDHVGLAAHVGLGEQACNQLRANARRVTEDHGDSGFFHASLLKDSGRARSMAQGSQR